MTFIVGGIIAGGIAAAGTIGGAAIGAHQQKQAAKGARREAARLQGDITRLEEQRNRENPIINPYAGAEDLSSMIEDLSGLLENPFAALERFVSSQRFPRFVFSRLHQQLGNSL